MEQEKVEDQQQEDNDGEEQYEDDEYLLYPEDDEDEPRTEGHVPRLDFRVVHCIGMAAVAAAILAIVISVNGGTRKEKAVVAGTAAAPAPRTGAVVHTTADTKALFGIEDDPTREARTSRYLESVTEACQDTDDALPQMQRVLNEYSAAPQIRNDGSWRNRITGFLVAADGAADHLASLSDPPTELVSLHSNLRMAGRELRASVHNFALTLETGNSLYLSAAAEHLRNSRRIADQATDEYAAYRKTTRN